MILIDGSYLEGGGQVIRSAMAMSVVTGKACKVVNIRKNRKNPGLKTQHLYAINALKEISNAKVKGLNLGSTELVFKPTKITHKDISIKIPTAGSITLVLQALLLPLLYSNKTIMVSFDGGATDTVWSPSFEYFRRVILENLKLFGIKIKCSLIRRGFYPKGGAKVGLIVHPWKNKRTIDFLDMGSLKSIDVCSIASSNLKRKNVAERQLFAVRNELKLNIREHIEYVNSLCPGSVITIVGNYENGFVGSDAFGRLNISADEVGKKAVKKFLKNMGAIDEHMADNLIPFLALVGGKIKVSRITNHTKTNIWVVEKFIKRKFNIEDNLKIISC